MPSAKKPAGREARPKKIPSTRRVAPKKPTKPASAKVLEGAAVSESAAAETAPVPEAAEAHRPEKRRPAKTGGKTITILQYASGIACPVRQKRVLRSLGLRHPHHRVVRPDNEAVRGMVLTIPHLVRIVEDERGA